MTVIKGILFDKDGTLIDFMASWMPAIHEAAKHFSNNDQSIADKMLAASGYDKESAEIIGGSILAAANNQQIAECWSQFLEIQPDTAMVAQLNRIFLYHNKHSSVAVTDLPLLFSDLKSRGIKLGLATSDSEEGAIATLQALQVYEQMDFVCGYNSGHGIKPEAGMVNAFANQLGLSNDQIMVVGDNTHDLHMAHNAKAKLAVGVLTGTSSVEKLHEAAYVLNDVAEIPALLDKLSNH